MQTLLVCGQGIEAFGPLPACCMYPFTQGLDVLTFLSGRELPSLALASLWHVSPIN
jgi:hypothetical protein